MFENLNPSNVMSVALRVNVPSPPAVITDSDALGRPSLCVDACLGAQERDRLV